MRHFQQLHQNGYKVRHYLQYVMNHILLALMCNIGMICQALQKCTNALLATYKLDHNQLRNHRYHSPVSLSPNSISTNEVIDLKMWVYVT